MKYTKNFENGYKSNCESFDWKLGSTFSSWHLHKPIREDTDFEFYDKENLDRPRIYWALNKHANPQAIKLEKEFKELSEKWKNDTGLFSTTSQKVINDSYLDIIALGKDVVPFILKDLEDGGTAQWHTALKVLTKTNPVNNDDLSRSKKIKEAWITWGKTHNLI